MAELFRLWELPESVPASVVSIASVWGWALLCALARLMGLFSLCPVFGSRSVSFWMRLVLSGGLAIVMTPVLVSTGFAGLPTDGWSAIVRLGSEIIIGALLGCGVLMVFAGLRLAGELIDQQAGAAASELFDPHSGESTTLSGQLLTITGTLALLCITPGNGHLLIVSALLDSFSHAPSHFVWNGAGIAACVSEFGYVSLLIGLQVAAPVVAAGAIVSWGIAALSGSSGSPYAVSLLGVPIRVVVSLGVLAMCLSGASETLLMTLDDLLHRFPVVMNGA